MARITYTGGGQNITGVIGQDIFLTGTNGSQDFVSASGLSGGSNGSITLDDNTQATVSNANKGGDLINLGTNDTLVANGGGYVIRAGTGANLTLRTGGGAFDTVYASSAQVLIGPGAGASIYGDNNVATVNGAGQLSAYGGSNTINVGSGASGAKIWLSGTSNTQDVINGYSGFSVGLDTNVNAYILGNGISVALNDGDNASVYGAGNTITNGTPYDNIFISSTNGTADTLYASGVSHGLITIDANTQVRILGNNNSISESGGGGSINIQGAGSTLRVSDAAGAEGITSNGNTIIASNQSHDNIYGSGNNIQAIAGFTYLNVYGGGNNIGAPQDFIFLSGTGSNADTIDSIAGTVTLDTNVQVNITAANARITAAPGDVINFKWTQEITNSPAQYVDNAVSYNLAPGILTISNQQVPASTHSWNRLQLGVGASANKLWFERSGNDLQITELQTQDHIDIQGWFSTNPSVPLTAIGSGDGLMAAPTDVLQLVQAMATFEAHYAASGATFNPSSAPFSVISDPAVLTAVNLAWHH